MRDNEITFDISFCIPDTDIYYPFELVVSDNGSIKNNEIIEQESDMWPRNKQKNICFFDSKYLFNDFKDRQLV